MMMPTPEQERLRIAAVYSAMSDEELGQIADSGDELSTVAQEALMAQAAFHICKPTEKLRFQYTTSSSSLQKKLGVN